MDEAVDLGHVHETWRELGLGALGDGFVFANDPGVLFEIAACGKGVGEAIELVVIGWVEAYQALQVRTSHDQGSYQIDGLRVKLTGALGLEVRSFELVDVLGQDPPLAQRPPQQFDSDPSLELVLFDLLRRVVAVEMDLVIPRTCQILRPNHVSSAAYSRGRTARSHALLVKARLWRSLK